jgi:hypothetical protein
MKLRLPLGEDMVFEMIGMCRRTLMNLAQGRPFGLQRFLVALTTSLRSGLFHIVLEAKRRQSVRKNAIPAPASSREVPGSSLPQPRDSVQIFFQTRMKLPSQRSEIRGQKSEASGQ